MSTFVQHLKEILLPCNISRVVVALLTNKLNGAAVNPLNRWPRCVLNSARYAMPYTTPPFLLRGVIWGGCQPGLFHNKSNAHPESLCQRLWGCCALTSVTTKSKVSLGEAADSSLHRAQSLHFLCYNFCSNSVVSQRGADNEKKVIVTRFTQPLRQTFCTPVYIEKLLTAYP